ncbi:MAG TPA: zinc ribbon domain-containing protein [Gammaproteobacteria bacterium]|nr:zinc ribbon domain-containing protein [Gammaproteobacteria bacterium]
MPIYEYQCQSCGHQLEEFQKISDAALTECPQCHQSALNKLVSAAGFQLKGSGWYMTDYRNKDKVKQTEESADSQGGTTSSTSSDKTTGDSTPASTTTTDTGSKGKDSSTSSNKNDKSAASS